MKTFAFSQCSNFYLPFHLTTVRIHFKLICPKLISTNSSNVKKPKPQVEILLFSHVTLHLM